jgi:F-type H+-transporting ATPase subunit gamma
MTAEYEELRSRQRAVRQVIPLLEAIRSVAEISFRRADARRGPLKTYSARIDSRLAQLQGRFPGTFGDSAGSVLLVISSERGLCGPFNERLIAAVRDELARRRRAGEQVVLVCLGHQGQRLLESAREPVEQRWSVPFLALPSYLDIEKTVIEILDLMEDRGCQRLLVMYNQQLRRFQYQVTSRQLFPIDIGAASNDHGEVKPPSDSSVLYTQLVTERVLIDLYHAVVESAVSENLARVAAMRLAADNARRILDDLTLAANRAHQIAETNALLEIYSGFETSSHARPEALA